VIAFANVVNLLLARAMQRRREIAVRLALGVSRARLVRLLVTESVLLAVVAGGAAVIAAVWGGALLRRLLMPATQFATEPLDARTLAFALVLAIAAGALAGLVPALRFASPDLTNALKAGSRVRAIHRSRLRDSLVVLQAALSVVLLVGAVLFVRSLQNVEARDIGYAVDQLVFASVTYDTKDSARDATLSAQLQAFAPRIAVMPGVQHVALTSMRPRWGFTWTDEWVPDFDTAGKKLPSGMYTAVSPDYFATTGTRLLRGRTFDAAPAPQTAYTVIVNQAMANALWPARDPIGHCIYFKGRTSPCATVIGVAQTSLLQRIDEKEQPQFYVSVANPPLDTWGASDIIVRTDHDRISAVERSLRTLLAAEFPGSIPKFITMSEAMEPEYRPWQLGATLFTLFGVLALVVAAIGVYSTVSYAVSERAHEFGVRVALGARTGDVLRHVLAQGLRTVALGVVIGILMALAAGRLVAALLYEITPNDPAAMGMVVAILLTIATLAALIPAWRAAKVDPIAALRAE
jgi:predicted permease